jgi:hypothetical protein
MVILILIYLVGQKRETTELLVGFLGFVAAIQKTVFCLHEIVIKVPIVQDRLSTTRSSVFALLVEAQAFWADLVCVPIVVGNFPFTVFAEQALAAVAPNTPRTSCVTQAKLAYHVTLLWVDVARHFY